MRDERSAVAKRGWLIRAIHMVGTPGKMVARRFSKSSKVWSGSKRMRSSMQEPRVSWRSITLVKA